MKKRDSNTKNGRKKPHTKKPSLGKVFILDFYPQGKSLSRKYADDFNPLAVVISTDRFQFFDVILKRGTNVSVGESMTISSSNPTVFKIKKTTYNQLSDSAVDSLPEIVREIVKTSETRFIRFLNGARPLTSQMHQLQLIPGIGNKRLWQILEARKKTLFETFEDFKERTGISDPILAFTNRIINEIKEERKIFSIHRKTEMIRLALLNYLEEGNLKKYTREIILEYAIAPKKGFSQNFVVKKALIDEILRIAQISDNDSIVEVGGGIGTLTYFLLNKAKEVFSYEIDPLLSSILKKEFYRFKDKLKVISGDFLKEEVGPTNKIISNLPYSISSPFISKITNFEIPPELVVVTVQEEFANHLCAKTGSSNYSRLSVYSSYFFKFEKIKKIPPEYFFPKPKVSSYIVKGTPLKSPDTVKDEKFFPFLTAVFTRKHRKARNNFGIYKKKLIKTDRIKFQNLIDSIDNSSIQPINLTSEAILDFYIDFQQLIEKEFADIDFW